MANIRAVEYYLVQTTNYDHINRMWLWCQFEGRSVPMYRTRISLSNTGWVIELEDTPVRSLFLLQFSSWVSAIGKPYYLLNAA
jgi:hypothetical protein